MGKELTVNPFGALLLSLAEEIKECEAVVEKASARIKGIQDLRLVLNESRRLCRGEMTGDQKLDAALYLSVKGSGLAHLWIYNLVPIFEKIKEVERRLNNWPGGILLADLTSQMSDPYCPEFFWPGSKTPN